MVFHRKRFRSEEDAVQINHFKPTTMSAQKQKKCEQCEADSPQVLKFH